MSRLGAALRCEDTGQRRALMQPLRHLSAKVESMVDYRVGRLFIVGAKVEARATLTDADVFRDASGAGCEVLERAKRQIKHEVFGEFIDPLHRAIYALNNYETREAADILRKVIEAMGNDEPMPQT